MGFFVNVHQASRVDGRVALRRRKRGVTKKFLYRAQVTACEKQVRRKAVPKRVRCGGRGQAKAKAGAFHRGLDQAGINRPAANTPEQWGV